MPRIDWQSSDGSTGGTINGRWCARIRTAAGGGPVGPYQSAVSVSYRTFDTEFEARGIASAYNGKFGILRDRGSEKFLGPDHYFTLIEDYEWHGT